MIVCVLGMHKSGTTLVAETLHHSGIHMADVPDDLGYDDSNKFERHEAQLLNRDYLRPVLIPTIKGFRLRHAGLDRAGYPINVDSVALVRTRRLRHVAATGPTAPIESMVADISARHDDWGFKDPRTCLTYELWKRALPSHRVVAIYRPFDEVLMRYRVSWKRPIRLARVARSWLVYNEMMVAHLEASSDFLLLRYDELMHDDDELARVGTYLGITLTDRRRADLYRARGSRDAPVQAPVRLPRFLMRRAAAVQDRLDQIRLDRIGLDEDRER